MTEPTTLRGRRSVPWLLRLFGVKPEPDPRVATWECPTCGHSHPVGTYVLGQIVPQEQYLREQYESGQMNADTFVRLMEQVRHVAP